MVVRDSSNRSAAAAAATRVRARWTCGGSVYINTYKRRVNRRDTSRRPPHSACVRVCAGGSMRDEKVGGNGSIPDSQITGEDIRLLNCTYVRGHRATEFSRTRDTIRWHAL